MVEHAAAVRRNDASSQFAAHSTGSGHTFKFDEAEILARDDNRVSRELLESWFTGPQSINKCNDLPTPYLVQRLGLGGVISYADLAVETIELLLREKYDEMENRLGHAQFIQPLKFCLKTYFTFDGTIYEQVKGTPMRSPISGLIAEAVLRRLE
nr:unnamed protein product [Spirometra erinaceieuropaei]